MNVTISRWGNSLGVRIPKTAAEEAGLKEGDRLELSSQNGQIVMVKANRPSLRDLLVEITSENRHVEVFSTPMGSEIW